MTIRGEVETEELGNIFQMVAGLNHRSLLVLRPAAEYEIEHRLLIEGDSVQLASPPRHVPLAGLLLARGLIDLNRYFELRDRIEKAGLSIEERLSRGKPNDRELAASSRELRFEEAILEALGWGTLIFRVRDGREVPDPPSPRFRLDALLFESARRLDERRKLDAAFERIIPVFAVEDASLDSDRFSDVDRLVYSEVDGLRGLAQIEAETGLPRIDAANSLQRLIQAGLLRPAHSEELRPAMVRVQRMGHLRVAARIGEAALALAPKDVDLQAELAALYERLGEPLKANTHDLQRADRLESRGLREELQRTLFHCWRRLPSDFSVLRRLAEVVAEDGALLEVQIETPRIASDLRELGSWFEEQGDLVSSLAASRLVWRIDPLQLGFGLEVARRASLLGHLDEARALMEHIAVEQTRAGRLGAARATYVELLRLIPDQAARYRRELRRLERENAPEKPKSGVSRRFQVALAAGVLCLLAGPFLYANWAERRLRQIWPAELSTQLPEAERQEKREALALFAASFPLTPAAARATEVSRRLEGPQGAERNGVAPLVAAQPMIEDRVLSEAYAFAELEVRQGRVEDALLHLSDLDLTRSRPGPARAGVARLRADLESYLAQATALRREADRLRSAGDLDGAYAAFRELLDRYSASRAALGITLPMRLVTGPGPATITAPDGRRVPSTIEWEMVPGTEAEFWIERAGQPRERFRLRASGRSRTFHHVQSLSAERTLILPESVVALQARTGGGLSLLSESGRLIEILPGDNEPRLGELSGPLRRLVLPIGHEPRYWACKESGLIADLAGNPRARIPLEQDEQLLDVRRAGEKLYALTSRGLVFFGALTHGECSLQKLRLPSPVDGLWSSGDSLLVRYQGGGFAFVRGNGEVEEPFQLEGVRILGPSRDGAFLVNMGNDLGLLSPSQSQIDWRLGALKSPPIDGFEDAQGVLVLCEGLLLCVNRAGVRSELGLPQTLTTLEALGQSHLLARDPEGGAVLLRRSPLRLIGRLAAAPGPTPFVSRLGETLYYQSEPRVLASLTLR